MYFYLGIFIVTFHTLIHNTYFEPGIAMSKENGAQSAAEKGKGKIEDDKTTKASKKPDEQKKDKDGKPTVNGKIGEDTQDG